MTSSGIDLHVVERGAGAQTVVFSHSFLLDHRHFEPQIAALEDRYRIIAYDHRDHGRSGRAGARYGIDDLVADGIAVIEQTGSAPCHWVGLSAGGFVGMRVAIRRPDLLRSLVLMDTAGGAEPLASRLRYNLMLAALPLVGTRPFEGTAMRSLFGRTARADPQMAPLLQTWRERMRNSDPAALVRFGRAIWSRDDVLEDLGHVSLPTLAIAGAEDRPIPPSVSQRIARAIPGARFEVIAGAGHICTIERPEAVNRTLRPFIDTAAGI